MRLQVSFDWILLLFIVLFYFSIDGGGTNHIAAAPNTACPRDHPGHIKCREIEADCFLLASKDYQCVCSKGYWMIQGKCRKSDWCSEGEIGDMVCKSNGTMCKNVEWTADSYTKLPYKCECQSSVVQSRICSVTNLYCQQKGAKSYQHGNITLCDCEDSDCFFDYSSSKCQNLDYCPFQECKGKYEECQGSMCVCKTGYERIDNVCKPRNYCLSSDICGQAKCEEGPEDEPKNIRCYCDSGYVLARVRSVPYCKLVKCETHSLNPCDHICLYSADKKSFTCACFAGHTLKTDNITCEILPSHKCDYNICTSRSICVKLNGTEKCMCKNSLVGERDTCLDRCGAGLLRDVCPGECKSTGDGFRCICEGKYRLSRNQVTCEERRMCLKGEEGYLNCSRQNRTCVESPQTPEGFTCEKCLDGLQEHESSCTVMCEIDGNKRYCEERGGTCVSVNEVTREVKCKCPPLLVWNKTVGCVFARHSYTGSLWIYNSYQDNPKNNLNETLRYDEGDLDWKKLDHDMRKSLFAMFGQALHEVNILQCRPEQVNRNGNVYLVCMIELQLHFEDYGILQRLIAPTVCRGSSNTIGKFLVPIEFCFVPPYLILPRRNRFVQNIGVPFHRSNVCEVHYGLSTCPASTNCVPEDVGFSCRCKKGFVVKRTMFLNQDKTGIIEVCQDINECEIKDLCPDGTACINTIGDFECLCRAGLFRQNYTNNPKVDACMDACASVNCIYGQCESHDTGFYCRCRPGYNGVYCDEIVPKLQEDAKNTTGMSRTAIIVVGVLEAIIFITLLALAYVLYRLWVSHKRKQNSSAVNRNAALEDNSVRNPTIDHIHMSGIAQHNGGFRLSLEEDPDEPIYADCTQR